MRKATSAEKQFIEKHFLKSAFLLRVAFYIMMVLTILFNGLMIFVMLLEFKFFILFVYIVVNFITVGILILIRKSQKAKHQKVSLIPTFPDLDTCSGFYTIRSYGFKPVRYIERIGSVVVTIPSCLLKFIKKNEVNMAEVYPVTESYGTDIGYEPLFLVITLNGNGVVKINA